MLQSWRGNESKSAVYSLHFNLGSFLVLACADSHAWSGRTGVFLFKSTYVLYITQKLKIFFKEVDY